MTPMSERSAKRHYGAGKGYDPLFYMTLSTGIGGGIVHKGGVYRGADSYAGEIGHLTIRPDGPECLCGATAALSVFAAACGSSATTAKTAKELIQDPAFVGTLCRRSRLGAEIGDHVIEPGKDRNWRRHCEGGRYAVRASAPGTAPADHGVVSRACRCRSGSARR